MTVSKEQIENVAEGMGFFIGPEEIEQVKRLVADAGELPPFLEIKDVIYPAVHKVIQSIIYAYGRKRRGSRRTES